MSKVYAQQKKPHETAGVDSAHQAAPAFSNQAMLDLLKAPEHVQAKPLSQQMNEKMSQHFGVSMNGLKVFENENLNQLGETAFAHGNEIHVAKGQFAPGTAHGQEVLMHEAAHVVQQGMGMAHDTGTESAALEAQAQAVQAGGSMGNISGFSMPTATAAAPVQAFGRRLVRKIKNGWKSLMNFFKKGKSSEAVAEPQEEAAPAAAPAPVLPAGFDFMSIQKRGMSRREAEDAPGFDVIQRTGAKEHRSGAENQELNMAMREQWKLWNKTLTGDEKESTQLYTTPYYREMNSQLRHGGDDEEVQKHIDNVSSAVKKSILPGNMVLHRGAGPKVLGQLFGFDGSNMNSAQIRQHMMKSKSSLTNQVIQDKGFTSTSLNEEVATEFAKKHDGHLIQINAPAGSHGAYLDPISEAMGEQEVLLDKGQQFKIDDIVDDEKTGLMKIILSMIDEDEGQLR